MPIKIIVMKRLPCCLKILFISFWQLASYQVIKTRICPLDNTTGSWRYLGAVCMPFCVYQYRPHLLRWTFRNMRWIAHSFVCCLAEAGDISMFGAKVITVWIRDMTGQEWHRNKLEAEIFLNAFCDADLNDCDEKTTLLSNDSGHFTLTACWIIKLLKLEFAV